MRSAVPKHTCEVHSHHNAVNPDTDAAAISTFNIDPLLASGSPAPRKVKKAAETGFPNIDAAMAEARAKYAAEPSLIPPTEPLAQRVPTPSELDVGERIDNTVVTTAMAIEDAQKQLEAVHMSLESLSCAETPRSGNGDLMAVPSEQEIPTIMVFADTSKPESARSSSDSWTTLHYDSDVIGDRINVTDCVSIGTPNNSKMDQLSKVHFNESVTGPSITSSGSRRVYTDTSSQMRTPDTSSGSLTAECAETTLPVLPQSSNTPRGSPSQVQITPGQKPKQMQGQGWHILWNVDYTLKW